MVCFYFVPLNAVQPGCFGFVPLNAVQPECFGFVPLNAVQPEYCLKQKASGLQ
jgi:hypothetical protein